jgi:hypothetical protein
VEAELAELEARAAAMLADAEAVDEAEDARYGEDGAEADLPAELARREQRLARIQAARAAIEAEAAERARAKAEAAEQRRQQRAGEDDPDAVAAAGQRAAEAAVPQPRAQRNFTDPESRIMKNSDGAFVQAYNGQAVVDEANQIITAADVTDCAADVGSFSDMLDQCAVNAGAHPKQAVVDAGYCSEDNLAAAAARQDEHGTDTLIATGRLKHGEQVPAAPRGRIPANATPKQRMARKLRTKPGRAGYARRKAIVEPVFGQIMTVQNGRRLLLRGLAGARGEWRLLAACHNLRKIFNQVGAGTLAPAIG